MIAQNICHAAVLAGQTILSESPPLWRPTSGAGASTATLGQYPPTHFYAHPVAERARTSGDATMGESG